MSRIVCTVTPTDRGVTVSWYRSEITAERNRPMLTASRDGITRDETAGYNGVIPDEAAAQAEQAHQLLQAGGSADELVEWATHHREQMLGTTIRPVNPN